MSSTKDRLVTVLESIATQLETLSGGIGLTSARLDLLEEEAGTRDKAIRDLTTICIETSGLVKELHNHILCDVDRLGARILRLERKPANGHSE